MRISDWSSDVCSSDLVASIIEKEHPQVAALLIANLDPAVGAKVLELLPDVMQPDIMHRIARLGPITPEAVEMLNALLAVRPTTRQQPAGRSEEHTSELPSLMRISYAVLRLKNYNQSTTNTQSKT